MNGTSDARRARMLMLGLRRRTGLLTALILIGVSVPAATASATIRVQNYNDPAGDPMVASYSFQLPPPSEAIDFTLADRADRSFGPGPGTYVMQSRLPAGWRVADIQCVGPSPTDFAIDVAGGRVTITHGPGAEQTCSFTNRRIAAPGSSPPTGTPTQPPAGGSTTTPSGVAPTPLNAELPVVSLPRTPALIGVVGGRASAVATLRLVRRSVLRAQLLWHGTRVVGSTRVVREAGTRTVTVRLTKEGRRLLLRQGLKRPRLTLRVVVVQGKRPPRVFTFGVLVRL
jgi:hypothetical protein